MKNKKQKDGVLFLMPYLFFGGSERQVRYIIEGLEQNKTPVVVLVENGSPKDKEIYQYINEHPDIQFKFFNSKIEDVNEKNLFNKIKSLYTILFWMCKNIKKYNISWVMFTNLTGLVTVPFCKMLGCKILFSERNPGIKMCNNIIKRRLLLCCDKIVANSVSASQYMTKILKVKVECINNGIKILDSFDKKDAIVKKDDIIKILVPARITPVKNQYVILKAVKKIRDVISLQVQFVGQIEDEEYNKKLRSYVNQHHLDQEVFFLGYTNDIQYYYDQADLVILPSYEEGTPNVLLEAYLNNKKCLASDIIMNRDVCTDKNILFSVDDSEMLAEKIIWILILKNEKIEELLRKNYNFVCENYDLKKMQQKYIEIFNK